MSDTLNAADSLLAATSPRLLPASDAAIIIDASATVFNVNGAGVSSPTSISILARFVSMEGTVTFSAGGATLTSISGNTCAVLYADMSSTTAVVTASMTYRGTVFSTSVALSKVTIGGLGYTGDLNATYGADWSVNLVGDGKASDNATVGAADSATAMGFNPQFGAWPTASVYPTGWSSWGDTPTKETTTTLTAPYAVKWTVATAAASGMTASADFHTVPQAVGNYFRGSFDVNITDNNSGTCRPGYVFRLFTNSALSTYVDNIIPAGAGILGWQRVPFTASVGAAQQIYGVQIYQVASYTSMTGGASTVGSKCIFDNLTFDVVQPITPAQTAPSGMSISGLVDIDSQGNTNSSSYVTIDTQTAAASGGVSPYTYGFSLSMNGFLKMTSTSNSFTITAKGTDTQSNGAVTVTAVDAGGRSFVHTVYVSVGFGTGVPA